MDVELPSGKIIEGVPDDTPKDVIMRKAIAAGLATAEDFGLKPSAGDAARTLARKKFDQRMADQKEYSQPDTRPGASVARFAEGVGAGLEGLRVGIGQRLGLVSQDEANQYKDESVGALANPAGFVGSMVGQGAALAPVGAVAAPLGAAAATAVGAGARAAPIVAGAVSNAVAGAVGGAAQPTSEGESAAFNTAAGAGIGGLFGAAGGSLETLARIGAGKQAVEQAANQVRDNTAKMAVQLGIKLSPVEANPGNAVNQVLEGSGSGKFLTRQTALLENATKSDALVKADLPGFAPDAALTHGNLQGYRAQVVDSHYKPLAQELGNLPTGGPGGPLDTAMANVGAKTRALGAKFDIFRKAAQRVNDAISDVKGQTTLNTDDVVNLISEYRSSAKSLFNNARGPQGTRADFHEAQAHLEIASALEDYLQMMAQRQAGIYQQVGLTDKAQATAQLVDQFKQGRQLIAKSLDIDRALTGDGHVDALKLGRMALRDPNKFTGNIAAVAQIANTFPHVMGPIRRVGAVPQVSLADVALGAGTEAMTGSFGKAALAYFARPVVRATILSKLYQQHMGMVSPSYTPEFVAPAVGAVAPAAGLGVIQDAQQ